MFVHTLYSATGLILFSLEVLEVHVHYNNLRTGMECLWAMILFRSQSRVASMGRPQQRNVISMASQINTMSPGGRACQPEGASTASTWRLFDGNRWLWRTEMELTRLGCCPGLAVSQRTRANMSRHLSLTYSELRCSKKSRQCAAPEHFQSN